MGRIKHTRDFINDIVGEVAADGWAMAQDTIEELKDECRDDAYAQVEQYLLDQDIDVDDWEDVMGETLAEFIDEYIYAEWEV